MEKGVLNNFAKFTGEHLCQSLFLKSDYPFSSSNLENKRSLQLYLKKALAQVLSCEFCEIF